MSLGQLGEANVAIRATLEKLDNDLAGARSVVDKAVRGIGSHVQTIGKTLLAGVVTGVLAVGTASGVAALSAVSMASDFQDATNAIIVGTGASGQALAEMEQMAKNLAGTSSGLGHDFETLGGVIAEVDTRTDLAGEALEQLSGQVLTASRLAGGEAVENVRLLTRVTGDWGIANEDAGGTLDMLFAATQHTGIGLDRLQSLLVSYGVPMRNFGFSIEESAALLGKWEAEGVNLELVMGSLRQATMKFSREGVDFREGLDATIERIKNAESASEATGIAMEVFGARAGADMAATIRDGRFEIEDLVAALEDSGGALEDAGERTLKFGDRLEIMKRRGMVALIPLGEAVLDLGERILPVVERVIETHVLPALDQMAHFVQVLMAGIEGGIEPLAAIENALMAAFGPEITETVMGLVASVQEIIEQVQSFMATAWEALEPVVEFIAEFVEWQDVAVAMAIAIGSVVIPALWAILSPVLAVIAVGLALVGIISVVRRAWDEDWGGMATFLTDAWENRIKPALLALQRWVVDQLIPTVQNLYRRWVDEWWPQISAALSKAYETISEIFGKLKRWVTEDLVPTVIELYTTWSERWSNMQTALQNVWTVVEAIFTEVGRWLNDNLGPWVEELRKNWDEDWAEIQSALETVWAIIEPIWIAVGEWLDDKIPEALGKLEGKWLEVMGALEGPVAAVQTAVDNLLAAAQGFWSWLSSKTFNFKISLPDLPSWAIPESPLKIHTAWKDFDRDMGQMRIQPRFDLPNMERGLVPAGVGLATGSGGGMGQAIMIKVDARGATEPGAVRRAARTAVDEALRAAGLGADRRQRTR